MSKKRNPLRAKEIPLDRGAPAPFDFRLWAICSAVLLVLWAGIYLPHLRSSPRWYGDEFVTLMAGNSILDGTFANRALHYSFFSGFTNYQPLGCFLYAVAGHVFSSGGDILGARVLSTLLGLATAFAAFHLLFLRGLVIEGMAAAIIILAAPESVIHFRWVYPHHFVALGAVIIGLMLDLPRTAKRDWIIGLCCACAAVGHLLVIHVTLAALIVRWRHPGAWLRIAIPPGIVLFLSLCFGYFISGRQLFADISEVGLQYTTHNDGHTWLTKVDTIWRFFTWDWVHVLYVIGLIILALQRRWALVAFAGIISFAVIQNRPELPIFYYQAMIFAPLLGVCLACALQVVFRFLLKADANLASLRWAPPVLAAVIPGILLVQALSSSFSGEIITRNDPWVAPSDKDLEETAAWVNAHADKDDLVVAYWDTGWMLKGRWTDMMQCAAWQYGNCPEFYKRNRDHSEFLFPADVSNARYIIITPLDTQFCYSQGTIPALLQETGVIALQASDTRQWPCVGRTKTTFVLENPEFSGKVLSH